MPKRNEDRDSSQFTCPDCQEKFDAETGDSIVGLCGHLICSTCVKEKKTATCPVCKKRRIVTEEAEDSAAECSSVNRTREHQSSIILEPKNRHFLIEIANNLDPKSFLNLAQTCKEMHHLCFNTKRIRISFEIPSITATTEGYILEYRMKNNEDFRSVEYAGQEYGFLGSAENRKKLKNYPFIFTLGDFIVDGPIEDDDFGQMREFFEEFPIKKIREIRTDTVENWPVFVQLVETYQIDEACARTRDNFQFLRQYLRPISEEEASQLLKILSLFHTDIRLPERLFLDASVKTLVSKWTDISQDTFVNLIKRFGNSDDIIDWRIGCGDDLDFGHFDIFKTVCLSNGDENDGPLPEERPLTLECDKDTFSILRKDGKYLQVSQMGDHVVFMTTDCRHDDISFWEHDISFWDHESDFENELEGGSDEEFEGESEGFGDDSSDDSEEEEAV